MLIPSAEIMKYRLAGAAFLLCFPQITFAQLPPFNVSAYRFVCSVDDEIPRSDRSDAEKAAMAVAQEAMIGNPDQTYALMAKETQTTISPENIAKLTTAIKASGPFQNVHVAHSYFIEVTGGGDKLPPTDCYKTSGGPERATISMRPLPRQFHVEVAAHTANNDWSMFIWLIPEGDGLKVLSFSFNTSAISGRTSEDFLRLAREQNARGHTYNTAFLFQAAEELSSRGPNAMPFWKPELDKEVKAIIPPKDFTGQPPFLWHVGNQIFALRNGGVMGVGGNLYLVFDRRLENWGDNASADADNRAFVDAAVKAYPEFGESFQGIVARAYKPDGNAALRPYSRSAMASNKSSKGKIAWTFKLWSTSTKSPSGWAVSPAFSMGANGKRWARCSPTT
jgi:hypothetical protein